MSSSSTIWSFSSAPNVLAPLTSQGLTILNYIDDWLLCSPSQEEVVVNTSKVLSHISALGLTLNKSKYHLIPTQVSFVGMCINSVLMRAHLSQGWVQAVLDHHSLFTEGQTVTLLKCQRLTGLLAAAAPLIPLGLLHLHLWELFGEAEVDLFASAENTQCPLWFSMSKPPSPLRLDALRVAEGEALCLPSSH